MTEPEKPRPSGLRNPPAAVRGVGAGTLAAEGLVLLLAIVPLRVLGGSGNAGTITVVVAAVICFVLAGMMGRRWAWWAGSALQVALFAAGFLVHFALSATAVVFGLAWLYVLSVRRSVLGRR